jgi:hypothetical protein
MPFITKRKRKCFLATCPVTFFYFFFSTVYTVLAKSERCRDRASVTGNSWITIVVLIFLFYWFWYWFYWSFQVPATLSSRLIRRTLAESEFRADWTFRGAVSIGGTYSLFQSRSSCLRRRRRRWDRMSLDWLCCMIAVLWCLQWRSVMVFIFLPKWCWSS